MALGNLYILTAPSGAGKTTLAKALKEKLPRAQLSVSYTTRSKRPGEINGVHYWFVENAEFQNMLDQNEFLEHALVHQHRYGTSKKVTETLLEKSIDVILAIDWQGAQQIRIHYPDVLTIFILPPSKTILRRRLQARGQDSSEVIEHRLAAAKGEVAHYKEFNYVVVNDVLEDALHDIESILIAHQLTPSKQSVKYAELLAEWG